MAVSEERDGLGALFVVDQSCNKVKAMHYSNKTSIDIAFNETVDHLNYNVAILAVHS